MHQYGSWTWLNTVLHASWLGLRDHFAAEVNFVLFYFQFWHIFEEL